MKTDVTSMASWGAKLGLPEYRDLDAPSLWALAADYDRWGLAFEAELGRTHYRQALIDLLVADGQEATVA